MPQLLAIDDDPTILESYRLIFAEGDVQLRTAATAAEGMASFQKHRPDAVILDVRLPDMSGLDAFRRLHEVDPQVPIVLVTGDGTAQTAIEATRLGAFDYVVKPLDPHVLRPVIDKAFAIGRMRRVPAVLDEGDADSSGGDLLVGRCPAMQALYKAIGRVAPQDVTVLVRGESGTGKELVARAVFQFSRRTDGPFLAINCAAIPETLLESELFGHERGAFTGAERRRIGKFEQCHGGTLFLDEVGDLTPLTQTKLLRVLQEGSFERVGGEETIRVDVRVIAATNRDLEGLMANSRFRPDLYYRLNVIGLQLPPLRDRAGDLPLLVRHFIRRYGLELEKSVSAVAEATIVALAAYSWPGNVRELQSVLKRALLNATGPVLLPDFLPPLGDGSGARAPEAITGDMSQFVAERLRGGGPVYAVVIAAVERELIGQALAMCGNNQSEASRILGISRSTLRAKLAEFDTSKSAEPNGSGSN